MVINDIRFKGKRSIDWKEVRAYLKEYVGDFYKVASTGDVIYIGADLPRFKQNYKNEMLDLNGKIVVSTKDTYEQ